MPPLPDPCETIVRNVLIFPADGTEPRIIPKAFSEAASKVNPVCFFTLSVDLRDHYGKHMASTYCKIVDNNPNPITPKCNEGEFFFYSNVSPELPINKSAAQLIGIDPIAYESKLFWRGDIIVVKAEDWPGPMVVGGGCHKLYHDVDPSFQATAELVLRKMHELDDHREWIKDMARYGRRSVQDDRVVRQLLEMHSPPVPISHMKPLDLKHRKKDIQLWRKISQYYGEAEIETLSNKVCALCTSPGKPDLKVCAGCHKIPYCSKECQKNDWKYHKHECKSKKAI